VDYKSSGVDIEKSSKLIDSLKDRIESTFSPEVVSDIGGFSGVFDLSVAPVKSPLLVTSVDGVGTKLKLAFLTNRHATIGIDLVAMVVNDIIVTGAKPLFLLDYFATGNLDKDIAEDVISGIVEGCKIAQCSLIGGETAEMPGFYKDNEYDLAAFGVGVVDKDNIIDGSLISKGNKIIGIKSSGPHSNGYSLIRKIFIESEKFDIYKPFDNLDKPLIDALLEPTIIYVQPVFNIIKNFQINGMAHITGGGFIENIPRIISKRLKVVIDASTWEVPYIFKLIAKYGEVDTMEMFKTFNNGIGFIMIVPEQEAEDIVSMLNNLSYDSYIIGEVIEKGDNEEQIEFLNYKNVFKNI
jgi:phosphoribosylformylglycinamidine cyclo-ligase